MNGQVSRSSPQCMVITKKVLGICPHMMQMFAFVIPAYSVDGMSSR